MKQLKVTSGATDAFGTRPSDKVISFGRADAFRLMAVFEGIDSSTDAATPTVTLTNVSGTFTRGEKITGGTSKASARIINTSTPLSVVYTTANKTFSTNETITAESSGATATVKGTAAFTADNNSSLAVRESYNDEFLINKSV